MFTMWYKFLRIFYYPFLVWLLPCFSKKARSRIEFEKKNLKDPGSYSFHADGIQADYCFEFSSEGELEQVRPIIIKALEENEYVELIFSSESVEHQCEKLFRSYPDNLRYYRLNILTYHPLIKLRKFNSFITAKRLFLCRYDFFPELISYGKQEDVEFTLFWGSMKSYLKSKNNFLLKSYYESIYHSFDKIIASTPLDHAQFSHELNISKEHLEIYDFRPVQILKRIDHRESVLQNKIKSWPSFEKRLRDYPENKRIIYGSFWENELDLFEGFTDNSYIHVVVPHQLNNSNQIYENLKKHFDPEEVEIIGDRDEVNLENKRIIVLNIKGVLCELYSSFGHAYIGGGFGVSVHSLMEPFLSGCQIVCGPKVHRSTEYDLISQSHPDHLKIINLKSEFMDCISHEVESLSSLNSFIQHYRGHYGATLYWAGFKFKGVLEC